MNDQTSVGKRVQSLQIGNEFDTYTRVIIHAGQTTDDQGNTVERDFTAGNTTGRTMEIDDPLGTQAKANALLLKLKTWRYQPYTANAALLDPAAELGDGITISDTFSAIYNRDVTYSTLMSADISAPSDEEIDHEYPYIPKGDREYRRETAYTRSQLKINANQISAEVSRASTAEGTLSANITVNAGNISAEASRAQAAENTKLNHTNTAAAFGWSLTPEAFLLKNRNTTVFQFDKDGLCFKSSGSDVFTVTRTGGLYVKGNGEFTGKITATSGYIGSSTSGFEIGSTYIRNGMQTIADTVHDGIYLGTNGIALGRGNFVVTKAGALTAKSGTIGGISLNSTYGLYTGDKTTAASTSNGFLISKNGGIYIGAYDETKGVCPFQVASSGKVTASNIAIIGGSIAIKNGDENAFVVTNTGRVTANDLHINGGTISIKDNGVETFKVASNGAVTASNLNIRGGSIIIGSHFTVNTAGGVTASALNIRGGSSTIGSRFSVDSSGNMTATNATLSGTITANAGKIGGFNIKSSAIWNGTGIVDGQEYNKDGYNKDEINGIYIGTNGISIGKGAFKVNTSGNLTAQNGTFGGTVKAGRIVYGGDNGTLHGNGISSGTIGTGSGTALSSGAVSGINWGGNFGSMTQQQYTANWVCANHIVCYSGGSISGQHYGSWLDDYGNSHGGVWRSTTVVTGASAELSYNDPATIWVENMNDGYWYSINRVTGVSSGTSTASLGYLGY